MAAVNVNVIMVVDYKTAEQEPLFTAAHSLLQLLHERDCRRPFTPPNHWLIKYVFFIQMCLIHYPIYRQQNRKQLSYFVS